MKKTRMKFTDAPRHNSRARVADDKCEDTAPLALLHRSSGPYRVVRTGDAMHIEGPQGRIASFYGAGHTTSTGDDGNLRVHRRRMTTDAGPSLSDRLKEINKLNNEFWEHKEENNNDGNGRRNGSSNA